MSIGKILRAGVLAITLLGITVTGYAQYPDDALRIGASGYGIDARSLGMGNAMTGLAQGYSAVLFNPAGLAQSQLSEFTMGINMLGYGDNSTYLGNNTSVSSSQTDLSDLGIVYPFPTTRGSFVIGLGYSRGNDFNSALSINGFNPYSSVIPSLYYGGDTLADISYMDYLEDLAQNPLVTKNVQQSGKIQKSGGINNYLFSAAMDVAYNFSIGLTLNLVSGSYKYSSTILETDPRGIYNSIYFGQFYYSSQDDQDISGWNAKFGFLYRIQGDDGNTDARVGLTITLPTFVTINDNYNNAGTAYFTGPPGEQPVVSYSTSNGYGESESGYPGPTLQYDVTTPFKFDIGASGNISQLLLAGELEYVDWTQMEFSNSNLPSSVISDLNSTIKDQMRSTLTLRGGAELALASEHSMFIPYVRVGAQYLPSPYAGASADQAQKFLSGGVGAKIQSSISVDVAYEYGWWNTTTQIYPSTLINNTVYPAQSTSVEKISNSNFMFTFKYDF